MHRTLRESELFSDQLLTLGEPDRIDDALTGVYWALSTKPEVYDYVFRDIRLLKTEPLGGLPALSVRFRIVDDNTVELLHIEPTENGL